MSSPVRHEYAPIVTWFLRKNPLYLLSAATMAGAARLCIADAGSLPGSLRIIALTLLVLQIYEWLVLALLFALHHSRRAPEDEPSLIVVAALFWTGPIAATIEMTVLDPQWGALLAAAIAAVAAAEMAAADTLLRWASSKTAWIFALLTLSLVSALPSGLRTTVGSEGLHELILYGGWWLFAVYLPLGGLGSDARRRLPFTLILAGATAVHLLGMNHAFWCHASAFYASPALISLAFMLLRIEAKALDHKPWVLATALFLPMIAVGLCMQDFARPVPTEALPKLLRDPMTLAFLGTAAIWYYACWLRPAPILLHGASAAVWLALYRVLAGQSGPALAATLPWLGLYVVVAYLLLIAWLRGSRRELIAAIALHAVGFSVLAWDRLNADELLIEAAIGWSAWGVVHIAYRRPELWLRTLPILLLVQATWAAGGTIVGLAHGGLLLATLLVVGLLSRWTWYLWIGLALAAAAMSWLSVDAASRMTRPRASFAVLFAFLLLLTGALVSWRKARWLDKLSDVSEPRAAKPPGSSDT